TEFILRVGWNASTEALANRMERSVQRPSLVESGAVALAALLFAHLIPGSEMEVCPRGDRSDFWLPKLHSALEVSGTDHERELSSRCREKSKQMLENPRGWGGYVVVCCFAAHHRVIRWLHRTQAEVIHG